MAMEYERDIEVLKKYFKDIIPDYLLDRVRDNYEKYTLHGVDRIFRIAAILWYEASQSAYPFALQELALIFQIPYKTLKNTAKQLIRKNNLKYPNLKPIDFSYKIAALFKLNNHQLKLLMHTLQEIQKIPELRNKKPNIIAGAVLYILSKKYNWNITQREIFIKLYVSETSLRAYYKKLHKYIITPSANNES